MSFQTTYDQQAAGRDVIYPKAEDINFLGFNRDADRWKVDPSGTWTTPSGAKIVSASGTYDIPVYLTNPIPVNVAVDIETDSIKVWSASGTSAVETWVNNVIQVKEADPTTKVLVKKRFFYNANQDISEIRSVPIVSPSGATCMTQTFFYNTNDDIDYILESLSTW